MGVRQVYQVVFGVLLVAAAIIRSVQVRQARAEQRRRGETVREPMPPLEQVIMALVFLGMQVLPIIHLATSWLDTANYAAPAWTGILGTALFLAALWLLWRSHADLGRNWSAAPQIRDEQRLVTTGVYAAIRHPMYAAHLLWGMAQWLLLWNWIAGPAFLLASIVLVLYRVPREERMMLSHFGEAYRAYMQNTGAVFPRTGD